MFFLKIIKNNDINGAAVTLNVVAAKHRAQQKKNDRLLQIIAPFLKKYDTTVAPEYAISLHMSHAL